MALIKAHPELFEIGNHTQNHCNLRDGGEGAACAADPPTDARIQAELLDADAVFSSLVGKAGVPYWRPPYGVHDARVRAAAAGSAIRKRSCGTSTRSTGSPSPTAARPPGR